jgi:hypothetical protein
MRKIINSTYITLDGVIGRPQEWPSTGERGSEGEEVQTELLLSCDAAERRRDPQLPVRPERLTRRESQ